MRTKLLALLLLAFMLFMSIAGCSQSSSTVTLRTDKVVYFEQGKGRAYELTATFVITLILDKPARVVMFRNDSTLFTLNVGDLINSRPVDEDECSHTYHATYTTTGEKLQFTVVHYIGTPIISSIGLYDGTRTMGFISVIPTQPSSL